MKTADEYLIESLTPMLSRVKESYVTIDEMKQVPEWEACVKAIELAQKEAYNEALVDAAMLGKVEHVMVQSGDHPVYEYQIDKRSILRLKIEL